MYEKSVIYVKLKRYYFWSILNLGQNPNFIKENVLLFNLIQVFIYYVQK